MKHLNTKR